MIDNQNRSLDDRLVQQKPLEYEQNGNRMETETVRIETVRR